MRDVLKLAAACERGCAVRREIPGADRANRATRRRILPGVAWAGHSRSLSATLSVFALAVSLAACVATPAAGQADRTVLYDRESRYYRIQVLDYPDMGRRWLQFSKSRGIQSSMILENPDALDFAYTRSMIAALALHPAPKKVLLVGLGGAALPKFIQTRFPDVRLDIVELDPDVLKVANEYFLFKPAANTRVFIMDGRLYLKRTRDQYDVILLDAYAGDRIPFHLTTEEFLRLLKTRLRPGGVVATNLWETALSRFYYAELKTYQENFPQTYLFKAGDSGNVIVFGALNEKKVERADWVQRASVLATSEALGFDLAALVQVEYEHMTARRIVEAALTDDMAPVDTLRREHPKYFEEEQPAP